MRDMKLGRAAVLAAALAVVSSAPRSARAADPAAARDQLKIGYDLSQKGECAEAIPHFTESLKLDPKAITLINLAQCEEKVGRLADALGHWVDARSRALVEGNTAIEAEAEKRAHALEPRMPHLTLSLAKDAPKGAEVSRDGVVLGQPSLGVATSVNPGAHLIVVKAPGRRDASLEVSLAEGESKEMAVEAGEVDASASAEPPGATAPAERATPGPNPLVYVGFGAAIAGIGVGTVTGILALDKANAAKDACPDLACPDASNLDDVKTGRTLGTISTIGFVVGAVGAAVGIYGLLVGPSRKPSAPATGKAALYIDPSGLRGSF